METHMHHALAHAHIHMHMHMDMGQWTYPWSLPCIVWSFAYSSTVQLSPLGLDAYAYLRLLPTTSACDTSVGPYIKTRRK